MRGDLRGEVDGGQSGTAAPQALAFEHQLGWDRSTGEAEFRMGPHGAAHRQVDGADRCLGPEAELGRGRPQDDRIRVPTHRRPHLDLWVIGRGRRGVDAGEDRDQPVSAQQVVESRPQVRVVTPGHHPARSGQQELDLFDGMHTGSVRTGGGDRAGLPTICARRCRVPQRLWIDGTC